MSSFVSCRREDNEDRNPEVTLVCTQSDADWMLRRSLSKIHARIVLNRVRELSYGCVERDLDMRGRICSTQRRNQVGTEFFS